MTIERFRDVLASVGPDADAVELSELLWLARHLPAPEAVPEDAPEVPAEAPGEPVETPEAGPPRPRPAPPDPPAPPAELHAPPPSPVTGVTAREIWVPTAPMLTDPLGVQRALRPLKRRVPSRLRRELDEEATAARIADTRSWTPVLVPSAERWLSLTLVMDTGPAMRLWRPLARELVETLLRQGAFRDVRAAHLHPDGRVSATPGGPRRDAGTLLDPSGRQIVLVLSDCSGPHWWNGGARAAVRRWALTGPTAILQPLPERMWRRTAVPAAPGLATLVRPGGPNTELLFAPYDGGPPPVLPVPVLEIAPRWFAGWANLLAGGGPEPAAMADFGAASPVAAPVRQEQRLPVEERVRRFLAAASPEAAELAAHVAVSVPSLPVMRLIQHRVLGASGPSQLAEVLLSGLLRPEGDRYEFVPGARRALLDTLPRPEAQHTRYVLEAVSAEIERRAGTGTELFPALLHAEDGDRLLPGGTGAFATLSPEARKLLDRGAGPGRERPVAAEAPAGEEPAEHSSAAVERPSALWLHGLAEQAEQNRQAFFEVVRRMRRTPATMLFGLVQSTEPPVRAVEPAEIPAPGTTGSEHGLILGGAGPEGTDLLRALVLQLALSRPSGELDIVLVAGENNPLHELADLPHVVAGLADVSSPEWGRVLVQALENRFAALAGSELSPYGEMEQPSPWTVPELNAATLVVVLDDAVALLERFPELGALLTWGMREGLPPSVHLFAASDSLDLDFLPHMLPGLRWSAVFSGVPPSDRAALLGLGEPPPEPRERGAGHLRIGQGAVLDFIAAPLDDKTVTTLVQLVQYAELDPPAALAHPLFAPVKVHGSVGRFRTDLAVLRADPRMVIPVGTDGEGRPVDLDLTLRDGRSISGAITGPTGAGKSELLRNLLLAIALKRSPEDVNLVLLDGLPGPVAGLSGLPHVTATLTGPDHFEALAAALQEELDRRAGLPEPKLAQQPTLLVAIDHSDRLFQQEDSFTELLDSVTSGGARLGVHVIVSDQGSRIAPATGLWHLGLPALGRGTLSSASTAEDWFLTSTVDPDTAEKLVMQLADHDERAPALLVEASARLDLLWHNGYQPPGAELLDWSLAPAESRSPAIGLTPQTRNVLLNPLDHRRFGPHGLLVGKSEDRRDMLRSIVLSLALAYPPEQLGMVLAGMTHHPLGGEVPLPHVLTSYYGLLGLPDRLREFTDRLKAEIDDRAVALREAGAADWTDHRELRALMVVVDVSLTLPSGHRDLIELLVWIASNGRRLGVHLVVSASEVDGHPGWDRLFPLLTWHMSVGALPAGQNRRLHGRTRLPAAGARSFGHLTVPGSEPVAFQTLPQPADVVLNMLAAQMNGDRADSSARLPAAPEQNGLPTVLEPRPPMVTDPLPVGFDERGEPVVLRPFEGAGGLLVGGAAERARMATAIVHGLTARYGPQHLAFVIGAAAGEDIGGLGLSYANPLQLVQGLERQDAWERFGTRLAEELEQREQDLRARDRPPALFVVLLFPAAADGMGLRSLLEHFTPRARQQGVHFLLVTDRVSGGHVRDFVRATDCWRIAVGPEPEAGFGDLFPMDISGPLAQGLMCLWGRETGLRAFSPRPRLPSRVDQEIPIGVDEVTGDPIAFDFAEHPHLLIVGPSSTDRTDLFRSLFEETVRRCRPETTLFAILDLDGGLDGPPNEPGLDVLFATGAEEVSRVVREVGRQAHDRLPVIPENERSVPLPPPPGPGEIFLFVLARDRVEGPDPLETLLPVLGRETWTGLRVIMFRPPTPSGTPLGEFVQTLHFTGAWALFLPFAHGAEADFWSATPPESEAADGATLAARRWDRPVRIRRVLPPRAY